MALINGFDAASNASLASANKVTGAGFLATLFGFTTDAQVAVFAGLVVTLLGGVWGLIAFVQRFIYQRERRREEHAESAQRLSFAAAEHEERMRALRSASLVGAIGSIK